MNKEAVFLKERELDAPLPDNHETCCEKPLDNMTKELILLALAYVYRCSRYVEMHIKRAAESGATGEEITEALLIAVKKRSDPSCFAQKIFKARANKEMHDNEFNNSCFEKEDSGLSI